jgi:hypothetical protein
VFVGGAGARGQWPWQGGAEHESYKAMQDLKGILNFCSLFMFSLYPPSWDLVV